MPAVEATETWLVAGLADGVDNPEGISDIMPEFIRILYPSGKPPEMRSLRKRSQRYEKWAAKAAENLAGIVDKCPHFSTAAAEIASYAT